MKTELAKFANRLYDRVPRLHRAMYGAYKHWADSAERRLLSQLVRPGMTVFDIGAYIGIYTEFLAALVGPSGRVIAFEPEPRNVERLLSATRTYRQVEIVRAAVSDRTGVLRLYVANDLSVDHRSYSSEDTRSSLEVAAVALDDFVADRYRVHLIKMDIQGAELAALRGARQLLNSNPAPVLLLEYWPYGLRSAGEDPVSLITELESAGFEVSSIGDVPLPNSKTPHPDDYINLIAVRKYQRFHDEP